MTPRRKRSVSPRRSIATTFVSWRALGQLEVSLFANQTIDAMRWARRLRALAKSTDDPDDRAWIEWYAAFAHAACGRIEDARAYARDHDKIVSALTPHLAIHGLGLQTMIDELAGRWDCIRAIGDRLESAVAANAAPAATWMRGRSWTAPSPPISPETWQMPSVSRHSPIRP